ncbi:M48 family metallopeptidase [Pseudogemmobacter sonorensis]|uniref:M48 family metallopeptidase n=1 Tax=Pseudogemmobacter sonorensis TaxID=2989681 RepID=UPI00367BEBC6
MKLLPGLPEVDVTLRRSARARRFSLRVSRLDGKVTLTLPGRARESEALAFLASHEGWLRDTLAAMPESRQSAIGFGTILPVEGRALRIEPAMGRAVRVAEGRLLVPGDQPGPKVAAFLKVLARDRLARASTRHAASAGRAYTRLTLRDTRSRWGSCTESGALMYSWRLVMAPPEVLDYVAAHEVAHLIEMNHSPAFWAVVTRLCPDWKRHRGWLRNQGQDLHRYRFGD